MMKIKFKTDRGILGLYLRMTMHCGSTTVDLGDGDSMSIMDAEETLESMKDGVRLLEENIAAMKDRAESEAARK